MKEWTNEQKKFTWQFIRILGYEGKDPSNHNPVPLFSNGETEAQEKKELPKAMPLASD